jgi:histone H1/5
MTPALTLTASAELMRASSAILNHQIRLTQNVLDEALAVQRAMAASFLPVEPAKAPAQKKAAPVEKAAKKPTVVAKVIEATPVKPADDKSVKAAKPVLANVATPVPSKPKTPMPESAVKAKVTAKEKTPVAVAAPKADTRKVAGNPAPKGKKPTAAKS